MSVMEHLGYPVQRLFSFFQKFLSFILWHFLDYVRDVILFIILTYLLLPAIGYFKRNVIFFIWAVVAVFFVLQTLINWDFFTSLEPLEEGPLKQDLSVAIAELEFPIENVYHVEGTEQVTFWYFLYFTLSLLKR